MSFVVKALSWLGCFGVRALGRLYQCGETCRIIGRDVRQNLAVKLHTGFFQSTDELVIADALGAGSGADADNPDGAVLALLLLRPL